MSLAKALPKNYTNFIKKLQDLSYCCIIADLREFMGKAKVLDDITLLVLKQQGDIVHNLRSVAVNSVAAIDIGFSGEVSP
ncbi:MAG: hypothetical protein MUE44_06360 [Oscillatoriaceae cyanobacterium Prado104]|nr:hypothetical protein [Oscillatoriaceae cyanobacterium Prado104]